MGSRATGRDGQWRRRSLRSLAVALALLIGPAVVTALWSHPPTRHYAHSCCFYRPVALRHGRVWLIAGSALLLINPNPFGPTALMTAFVFLPYVIVRGPGRAAIAFAAGHLVATLGAAAVIFSGIALHVGGAHAAAARSDVGMSAGLAASAGALGAFVARRAPLPGGLLIAGLTVYFGSGLLARHFLVDGEHLVALATGIACEVVTHMHRARPPSRRAALYAEASWQQTG